MEYPKIKNKQTFVNMKKDLIKCYGFYILVVVERSSGRIIDITLVVDPQPSQKYPYTYRIIKGLVTPDIQELKKIGQKVSGGGRKTDEKMSQDDIDQLIEDFYAKDLNIRLQQVHSSAISYGGKNFAILSEI